MTRRRARWPAEAVSLIVFASVIVIETLAGRMHPWFTPDSAGYLAIRSWPACLGGQRIPLYGWFVNAVFGMTGGYGLIPWLQAAAYGAAMFYFLRGLPADLFGRRARLALGLALALSNVLLIWICALVPCLLGVAALIASLTETVALASRGRASFALLLRLGLFEGLAFLLWPGLLPTIGTGAVLVFVLARLHRKGRGIRRGALALLAGVLPFLLVSSVRLATVGDFNIVSFGGFQMSGMAALMLSPGVIERLPAGERPLATAILAGRRRLEASGQAIATPRNSTGKRSLLSEEIGYFGILARTHDDVLYHAVAPQQEAGESWVAFNRRLMRFALSTVRADRLIYIGWVVGAAVRMAGHMSITDPAFLVPMLMLCVILGFRGYRSPEPAEDPSALIAVVLWTTAGALALSVLVTYPALRYIDVASIVLPALPIYGLLGQLAVRPVGPSQVSAFMES